jgi:hypothetical protein
VGGEEEGKGGRKGTKEGYVRSKVISQGRLRQKGVKEGYERSV